MKKKISELPLDTQLLEINLNDYMSHGRPTQARLTVRELKAEWEECVRVDYNGPFDEWFERVFCYNDGGSRRVVVALVNGAMEFIG